MPTNTPRAQQDYCRPLGLKRTLYTVKLGFGLGGTAEVSSIFVDGKRHTTASPFVRLFSDAPYSELNPEISLRKVSSVKESGRNTIEEIKSDSRLVLIETAPVYPASVI